MRLRLWKRRRPAGRYVCSAPRCAYAWEHDGRGGWTGPYFPDDGTTYARGPRPWADIEEMHADCAPRLQLVT